MKLVSIFFKASEADIRAKRKFQSKSIHNDSKATSKILLNSTVQITGKRTPGKQEEQAF